MKRKPFSQSSENNKQAIYAVLAPLLEKRINVLEIGSGTGQHAVFFANQFKHINWQPSDLADKLDGINAWSTETRHHNIHPPIELNVSHEHLWPNQPYDLIFSANTTHIMSIEDVENMFEFVSKHLIDKGIFFLYGPFNQHKRYTSESNHDFDRWLKGQSPHMGLRDVESLENFASQNNMRLSTTHDMPKNNKSLVFKHLGEPSRL